MPELWRAVLLAILLAVSATADTYEVTRATVDGEEIVSVQYVQGKRMRLETHLPAQSRHVAIIQDSDRKLVYRLDLQSQEYIETSLQQRPDLLMAFAELIGRPPRMSESGKTVNIYYETIDKGERKQFFGRTARHVILRERHVAEPGACDYSHQIEKDGWYLPKSDPSHARHAFGSFGFVVINSRVCRDSVFRHGEPFVPGVPVWEKDGAMTREVLELSNLLLQDSLFEIPGGFKKVDALPGESQMSWSTRIEAEWGEVMRAFASWVD